MTAGRPTKYDPKYCEEIIEYFSIEPFRVEKVVTNKGETEKEVPNKLPLLTGFCRKIGINRDTLNEWGKTHKEFSDSIKKAKELQEYIFSQQGLARTYDTTFAIFFAKNVIGWKDKQETEITGKDGSPIIFAVPSESMKSYGISPHTEDSSK